MVEVNKIFHAFEERLATISRHPEILQQLPDLLARDDYAGGTLRRAVGGWRVLDFGCGTGFASEQILRHLPAEQIAHAGLLRPFVGDDRSLS